MSKTAVSTIALTAPQSEAAIALRCWLVQSRVGVSEVTGEVRRAANRSVTILRVQAYREQALVVDGRPWRWRLDRVVGRHVDQALGARLVTRSLARAQELRPCLLHLLRAQLGLMRLLRNVWRVRVIYRRRNSCCMLLLGWLLWLSAQPRDRIGPRLLPSRRAGEVGRRVLRWWLEGQCVTRRVTAARRHAEDGGLHGICSRDTALLPLVQRCVRRTVALPVCLEEV